MTATNLTDSLFIDFRFIYNNTLMKLKHILLLVFTVIICSSASADDGLYVKEISISRGGDAVLEVMLNSGIYGKVAKIKDEKIAVEIAPNVEIWVDRMCIGALVTEPKKTVDSSSKKQIKK